MRSCNLHQCHKRLSILVTKEIVILLTGIEIINHRYLRHPNIVIFKEVILTPTHLAIVMEYASRGELFERICNARCFNEDEQACHRDLKLENTLLDGSPAPRLKICDFRYSKGTNFLKSNLHSQPKSTVGTPVYIAPEIADVWSCGVTLYVMMVGAYSFEDPDEPKDFQKTIQPVGHLLPFLLLLHASSPTNSIFFDHCSDQCNGTKDYCASASDPIRATGGAHSSLRHGRRETARRASLSKYFIDTLQVIHETIYFVGEKEPFSQFRTILALNEVFLVQITIKSTLHTVNQHYLSMVDDLDTFNKFPWGPIVHPATSSRCSLGT
ncbi:hypothetical protein UlMin_039337 [Ulmus minor]